MPFVRSTVAFLYASPLVNGLVAFGSAEAAVRVVRLGALLIVARKVTPEVLGTAALALTLFEMVRVLANVGIGQRLIVAAHHELASLCATAHRLFWTVCIAVAAVQLAIAAILATVMGLTDAGLMLAVLSLVYIAMPPGLVPIYLAMRENRMGTVARITAAQNMFDSAMTVVLVIALPGPWALVLPKLLAAPLWTILARRSAGWRPPADGCRASWREFTLFGTAILATEMLGAARVHGDKLIIGALFGAQTLGLYYFAFNAGLGITQSFVTACNLVVFPHLAKAREAGAASELGKAFAVGLAMLGPVVAAQALLAPFYVPIVFGTTWMVATPYVVLLSLAALPLYAGSIAGAGYRVAGRPQLETLVTALATLAALCGLAAGARYGLASACLGYGAGLAIVFFPAIGASVLGRDVSPQPILEGQ